MHRDIKPSNILITSLDPLHIKLTDFGLSKAGQELFRTFCGTEFYLAPEVNDRNTKYDSSVDIWALGVVIFKHAYGLKNNDGRTGISWCQTIIEQVNDRDLRSDDLVNFLSKAMIVEDPTKRYSARCCYKEALQLTISPRVSSEDENPRSSEILLPLSDATVRKRRSRSTSTPPSTQKATIKRRRRNTKSPSNSAQAI